MPRLTELKIKIKSLADEKRTIKHEVRKLGRQISHVTLSKGECPELWKLRATQGSVFWHGHDDVRAEIRSAHLAYGYMRGRSYKQLEAKCREEPNWDRVTRIVRSFGGDTSGLQGWILGEAQAAA